MWWPWYAALWAEAAVLDRHPDAASRLARSGRVVHGNPIAAAIVARGRAGAAADHAALARLTMTFAQLDCPYQQARTGQLTARTR
jgi:hypothetical protein